MAFFRRKTQVQEAAAYVYSPPPPPKDERLAVCPYCGSVLKKVPGAATKCPDCKETMYVRTDQVHRIRRVLTKDAVDELDDINEAFANGELDRFIELREQVRAELRVKFGAEPKAFDIRWALCNHDLLRHASERYMGHYRNTLSKMMEILMREGKRNQALTFQLMIFYVDMNNPNNGGAGSNLWGPLPDLERGSLLDWLGGDTADLDKPLEQIAKDFESEAERMMVSLKMPRAWSTVWKNCI